MTVPALTPFMAADGPLDQRRRAVVAKVAGAEAAKALELPTDNPLDQKRRYRTEVTRTELGAQPEAIRATWARNQGVLPTIAGELAGLDLRRAFLVGAGDSLAVMQAARLVLEQALGISCEPVQSLEFAYYLDHLVDSKTLVVTLSSSGATTRTVEAALLAAAKGAHTLALTNSPGSPLDAESSRTLIIEATRVGWPTQASTAALGLLYRLGIEIGRIRNVGPLAALGPILDGIPDLITSVIKQHEPAVAAIAQAEQTGSMFVFAGGGPNWPSAIIGAAKVKECSPNHALAMEIEEFHHYNSLKAGEPLWVVAPTGMTLLRAVDTVREAARLGGRSYVITTVGVDRFHGPSEQVLSLPALPEALSPLVYMVPLQLFGYHLAMAKFRQAEREAGQ